MENPQLHLAVLSDNLDELKALLKSSHPPDQLCKGQQTALHMAAHFGRTEAVHALLAAGADPTLRSEWNYTPIHFAALQPEPDCLMLVANHARVANQPVLNLKDKVRPMPLGSRGFH